jgi:hypothetical protein
VDRTPQEEAACEEPTFQLCNTNGEFLSKQWKKFMKDYNITNATM